MLKTAHILLAKTTGLSVLLALVLASCGSSQGPTTQGNTAEASGASSVPLTVAMPKAEYYQNVKIDASSDKAALERQSGGKVLIWSPSGGYAVVGYLHHPGFSSLSKGGKLEKNSNLVAALGSASAWATGSASAWATGSTSAWATGSASAWATGSASAWATGSASAWATGNGVEYKLMPPNTAAWMKINLMQAQQSGTHMGAGIKVAILDTGMDLGHTMLSPALAPSSDLWDFVDSDATPQEIPLERDANGVGVLGAGGYGHGTNIAGIVRQMAPAAQIMPLRVLGSDGSGDPVNVAAAVEWAISKGAKIISLSLGTEQKEQVLEDAINHATSQGILVLAATGNTGNKSVLYPASYADHSVKRLSVSSTSLNDLRSSFATYGSKVEIAAPGEQIYSAAPDSRLAAWSGTSMATPVAAGVAALALGESTSANTTCNTLGILEQTAAPLSEQNLGSGRLDADSALSALKNHTFTSSSECP